LALLVPGLDRPDLAARGERLLELALVVGAVLARSVEPALAAELGVLEAGADLRDREAAVDVEAGRRGAPAVEALGLDDLVGAGAARLVPLVLAHDPRLQPAEVARELLVDVVEGRLVEGEHLLAVVEPDDRPVVDRGPVARRDARVEVAD